MNEVDQAPLARYRCDVCSSERLTPFMADPPSCGTLHTDFDTNRFPDGHWVRITTEHYEDHGVMTFLTRVEPDAPLFTPGSFAERMNPPVYADCDPDD